MWQLISQSPLLLAFLIVVALTVALRIYRTARWMPLRMAPRDPQRLFKSPARAGILARAGNRCEHHGLLSGRCPAMEKLHLDHIHPHSRGGTTTAGNAQVLCSRHNKAKSSRIPYNWQLRALAKRRATYFPPGITTAVTRREAPIVSPLP